VWRCRRLTLADPADETGRRPDSATHRQHGRFDLIISAVNPHDTGWLAHPDWDASLTPTGLAAVLTHSEFHRGRLLDPHPAIMDTFRHRQLGCLDHIAVLDAPPAASDPTAAPNSLAPTASRHAPACPRREQCARGTTTSFFSGELPRRCRESVPPIGRRPRMSDCSDFPILSPLWS
jgi:hypothetical protein